MPEPAPKGIHPLFLRGVTCEKFGLKTGEGVNDLVDYRLIPKEDIVKEIQVMGVMSDFEPGKKVIESFTGDQLLIVVDKSQKYGETFLICYTEEAKDEYMKSLTEAEEALKEQMLAEMRLEEERKAAEYARQNVVYEDKPITPREWISNSIVDTDSEIKLLSSAPSRELITVEITRPKKFLKQNYKFLDKNADAAGIAEFRAHKDPNFKTIRENEIGIQVAPMCSSSHAQTTWNRPVNKSIQYEAAAVQDSAINDNLLAFLEKATIQIENALQQNETVDIFNETFRFGDDDAQGNALADNELRELKNFADPNYSKFKVLAAIDWLPKAQGLVAVSAVRNISFDTRIPTMGQTNSSFILLWDFRLLVKPLLLFQSQFEIFTFRFNRTNPNYLAGGSITGQVMLWDTNEAKSFALNKNNRGAPGNNNNNDKSDNNEEEVVSAPLQPKYVSSVDHSHKKCVADLFWLPPTTQINYRGHLVGEEHLDGQSHQFVTVAGDGLFLVWDIRYEQIFNDELRHIGRAKHIPTEKSATKDGGGLKPLWGPIFKAQLKRLEGVGELSLCKVCEVASSRSSNHSFNKTSHFPGDARSQFVIATEEGDVIFADLANRKAETTKEDEEEDDAELSCVKWIAVDHPRPSVCLQESPFFPQILLSVSDWSFHLWKVGEDTPIFSSPLSNTYLTAGAWSTSRPAVLYVACSDGQILVWDFTDSSFNPSLSLKATHSKITSMEFLISANTRNQLLAVGDEVGTLHILEVPRNLMKPVHKEESIMVKFLERELQRIHILKEDSANKVGGSVPESLDLNKNINENENRVATADATTAQEESMKAKRAAELKEEEEFLKLEAIFITEIGLSGDQLPTFVK